MSVTFESSFDTGPVILPQTVVTVDTVPCTRRLVRGTGDGTGAPGDATVLRVAAVVRRPEGVVQE